MLTPEQISFFRRNGYIVLPHFVDADRLAGLADVCDRLLAEEAPVDGGGKFHALGRGESLRFLRQRFESEAGIRNVQFSPEMTATAADLLDSRPCYMFNEQFVVKAADGPDSPNSAFAWHQDGSYVGFPHAPYLTMWVAIDPATEANGGLRILPRDLDKDSSLGDFAIDPATNERVCYDDDSGGLLLPADPGTLVVFSSTTMHCSPPNRTDRARRAWLCQYTRAPILDPETGAPKHYAILV